MLNSTLQAKSLGNNEMGWQENQRVISIKNDTTKSFLKSHRSPGLNNESKDGMM